MEDVNTRGRIFVSRSKLECGHQEFNSKKFHLHLTFKATINFNSDVFAAVAVVVAKAPHYVPMSDTTLHYRTEALTNRLFQEIDNSHKLHYLRPERNTSTISLSLQDKQI